MLNTIFIVIHNNIWFPMCAHSKHMFELSVFLKKGWEQVGDKNNSIQNPMYSFTNAKWHRQSISEHCSFYILSIIWKVFIAKLINKIYSLALFISHEI